MVAGWACGDGTGRRSWAAGKGGGGGTRRRGGAGTGSGEGAAGARSRGPRRLHPGMGAVSTVPAPLPQISQITSSLAAEHAHSMGGKPPGVHAVCGISAGSEMYSRRPQSHTAVRVNRRNAIRWCFAAFFVCALAGVASIAAQSGDVRTLQYQDLLPADAVALPPPLVDHSAIPFDSFPRNVRAPTAPSASSAGASTGASSPAPKRWPPTSTTTTSAGTPRSAWRPRRFR